MPLINLRKLKNIIKRRILPVSYTKSQTLDLPAHICAICHENQSTPIATGAVTNTRINNPYEADCGHRYCYYCIQSKLILEDGTWQCLRCGEEVKTVKRVIEKVVEEGLHEGQEYEDADGEGENGE